MKLSIVATLYHSAEHLEGFYSRVSAAARTLAGEDHEIILVNDGSPDRSLELAINLTRLDRHVIVVDLSRNFGHYKAIMAGLAETRGDQVFLIDSDLEEAPEWLLSFSEQLTAESCDVVYGVQHKRKGGYFERWSGKVFYKIFKLLTGLSSPENITTARLMSRRYVNALLLHQEREVFLAGLFIITGFDQKPQRVTKGATSQTTYTLRRKLSAFVNSVTSFSNAPLTAIFYTGVTISCGAAIYTGYLVIKWLCYARPPTGWTSVMASIWLLHGLLISFVGIIGIYLSKIFSESKCRPNSIVRQIYGHQPATGAASTKTSSNLH